jgi:hypothetical protein
MNRTRKDGASGEWVQVAVNGDRAWEKPQVHNSDPSYRGWTLLVGGLGDGTMRLQPEEPTRKTGVWGARRLGLIRHVDYFGVDL